MAPRAPSAKALAGRIARRCAQQLAVGAALANGTAVYEIITAFGSARLKVRFKATAAGSLDLIPMGPDFDQDVKKTVAYASLVGTKYTTDRPTTVAVVANTEASISTDLYGENYWLLVFTPSGAGVVTFADVSQV